MKCKGCKYNNDSYCMYFKKNVKAKKSCWAFEEKIASAVKSSFKFLNERG